MSAPPLPPRFELLEVLPGTPFERHFRCLERDLQREVLVKLPAVAAYATWTAPVRERLLREARALAKIRHPGIAPIHSVEATDEGPALVLDLPEGELLAERLARGPLEVAETVALGIAVGSALAHVHLQGIVHRGVGPNAIRLLANGTAQLGTFTFAKEFGVRGQASSLMHGKRLEADALRYLPDYSAPEQMAGQGADPRADLYALGCTLFRCLAGREAFPPGHEHEPMPDLRAIRKEVGKPLAEVIRKCAMHAKTARYATAQEVVDALQALAAPAPVAAAGGRGLWLATFGALGLALVAVFVANAWPAGPRGSDPLPVVSEAAKTKVYEPRYGKVHGLFVGIGKAYAGKSFAELRNPPQEVLDVASRLQANDPAWERPGAIQVLREADATYEAIIGALDTIAATAEPDDAVLFYFAGHGESDDIEFGLVTASVAGPRLHDDPGYLKRNRLAKFAADCKAKHVLMVLDCCHAGAVFPPDRGRTPSGEVGPRAPGERHLRGFAREFLASSGAAQKARDGVVRSPFCQALLDELDAQAVAGEDHIAAKYLGALVERRMAKRQDLQVPELLGRGLDQGSFVFRLKPRK